MTWGYVVPINVCCLHIAQAVMLGAAEKQKVRLAAKGNCNYNDKLVN